MDEKTGAGDAARGAAVRGRKPPVGMEPLSSPTATEATATTATDGTAPALDQTSSPVSTEPRTPRAAALRADGRVATRYQTFFDDSTPPPSPSFIGRSSLSNNNASSGWGQVPLSTSLGPPVKDGGYDYRYDHVAPPAPIPKAEGWKGLSRRTWWIILGAIIAAVILALAIGLGVGLSSGGSSKSGDKDSDNSQDSSNAAPSTMTIGTTHTATISTAEATQTAIDVDSSDTCPMVNNTLYHISGSTKTFLRLCSVDYFGDGGAKDVAQVWTASMEDCMVNCAGYDGCTACSWGLMAGDAYRDNHRCYLKTDLGKPTKVKASWNFAIMQ